MATVMGTTRGELRSREPMRARYPDEEGYVERDGVRTVYEVYGEGQPTLLLLPDLVDRAFPLLEGPGRLSGPPLPRHHLRRPRQRPLGSSRRARALRRHGVRRGRSGSARRHRHRTGRSSPRCPPERPGTCSCAPTTRNAWPAPSSSVRCSPRRQRSGRSERGQRDRATRPHEGPERYNVHHGRENLGDFLQFFCRQVFIEPHSTKPIEYAVGWASRHRRRADRRRARSVEAMGA